MPVETQMEMKLCQIVSVNEDEAGKLELASVPEMTARSQARVPVEPMAERRVVSGRGCASPPPGLPWIPLRLRPFQSRH